MKKLIITMLVTSVMMLISPVQAEVATWDEALTVADNWITLIIQNDGDWGGAEWAQVEELQEFKRGERLLGYFFRVNPKGYIVISLRKELAPVKAYSAISCIDPESDEGMTDFIKSGMERTLDEIEKQAGTIRLAVAQDVQEVVETDYRPDWEKLGLDPELFEGGLESGVVLMNYAGGQVLLSSNWHQNPPYNNDCEHEGCSNWNGRAKVGCVGLAGAQIMRYWAWPPYKIPFTVSYDWPNMPDTLTTSSHQVKINAVAKLCYEVGAEAGMDYGCSESKAWVGNKPGADMLNAYEDHFRYHDGADFDLRAGEGDASWFKKIKDDLNSNRPLQYCTGWGSVGLATHSMVCDGWKEVGGSLQCHMNDGNLLAWVDMTNLPGWEGMIKNIRPGPSLGSWLSEDPPDKHVSYWADSPACDPRGDRYGFRYFDQDTTGRNVTFHRGHYLQFLPRVKVRGTSPKGDYIRFIGRPSENTQLFSFKSATDGMLLAGIKIYNGEIRLYNKGSIRFH